MYRYSILLVSGLLWTVLGSAQPKKYRFSEPKMGSAFPIIIVCDDSLQAVVLAKKAYALVDSLNHIFSDYDPGSELNALNNTAGTGHQWKASAALWDILMRSGEAWKKSGGAFDITMGPLSLLWRKARKEKQFPSKASVDALRKLVGFGKLVIDTLHHSIQLPVKGMRLDLGGIAKGHIAQCVIDLLQHQGIAAALADAGGDMAMSDAPAGTAGWNLGVNTPETTEELLPRRLLLHNKAVATSGDVYQYMEHGGKKYSHIIDPRTGYGINTQLNVTVIASNGADADWLATACSILPITAAKKLAVQERAELLVTELVNGKLVAHNTAGFASFWKKE